MGVPCAEHRDPDQHKPCLRRIDIRPTSSETERTACRIALGVGSTTAYALAGHGELPFPAHRVGRQWVVPTAGLLAFLGLPPQEPPSTVAH
jgi:hypothetical protein